MINEEIDSINRLLSANPITSNSPIIIDESIKNLVITAMDSIFKDLNSDKYLKLTMVKNQYLETMKNCQQKIMEGFQKMKDAYQTTTNKDSKTIHELGAGDDNEIEISELMTINEFIKEKCQTKIEEYILKSFPLATTINKDYKIVVNDLHGDDILQDEKLLIKVIPLKLEKIGQEILFSTNIDYNYNLQDQIKVIEKILTSSIPKAFIQENNKDKDPNKKFNFLTQWYPETNFPKYANMIRTVKPLRILLDNGDFAIKIIPELQSAASKQTKFFREWLGAWSEHIGSAGITIIPNQNSGIKNVKDLYNLNHSYFNTIFTLIKQKLVNSGVPEKLFSIKKTKINDKEGKEFCFAVGNLNFIPNFEIIGENWQSDIYYNRNFYIQVNLEINVKGNRKIYPGVVLLLTDELALYNSEQIKTSY